MLSFHVILVLPRLKLSFYFLSLAEPFSVLVSVKLVSNLASFLLSFFLTILTRAYPALLAVFCYILSFFAFYFLS